MTETARRYMGNSVPRKEDAALLAGRATFTDNIRLPGMLHLAVLRSPHAHARITAMDTSAARELPGVIEVFTGDDLADEWAIGIPTGWPVTEDINVPDHWPLARGEVNHVGEGVAVVVADDRYKAQDALEHIDVDYGRSGRCRVEEALEDGSPLAHEQFVPTSATPGRFRPGNRRGLRKADVIVEGRYLPQRLLPSSIEPGPWWRPPTSDRRYGCTPRPGAPLVRTSSRHCGSRHQPRVVARMWEGRLDQAQRLR